MALPPPPSESESNEIPPHRMTVTTSQYHLLRLHCHIVALERELEREQQRRQEIINRYERLLSNR